MHFPRVIPSLAFAIILVCSSCKLSDKKKEEPVMKEPKLKEENVTYAVPNDKDSVKYDGYIVYDENKDGKRPAVLVIHEWWGMNDYVKMRARELAKLGYIAMAIDLYGNGRRADNPDSAGKLAGPFYQTPGLAEPIFDAARRLLATYPQTNNEKVAAIGYCFGGAQVINLAKMGENLAGVVSFHGNLAVMPADKELLKTPILVCHGGDDTFVPREEVDKFKKQMDSIGAQYTLKVYPGAVHAFTNPNATAMGEKFKINIRYNAAADTASWNDMKTFFNSIFNK